MKASHDELKLHILPMLDDKQGGRIIFVHGGTAAARTECVDKALHSLRVFDINKVNVKVSEQYWLQGYFAYIFKLMFGGKKLKEKFADREVVNFFSSYNFNRLKCSPILHKTSW